MVYKLQQHACCAVHGGQTYRQADQLKKDPVHHPIDTFSVPPYIFGRPLKPFFSPPFLIPGAGGAGEENRIIDTR